MAHSDTIGARRKVSYELEKHGVHVALKLWVNGARVGELCPRACAVCWRRMGGGVTAPGYPFCSRKCLEARMKSGD